MLDVMRPQSWQGERLMVRKKIPAALRQWYTAALRQWYTVKHNPAIVDQRTLNEGAICRHVMTCWLFNFFSAATASLGGTTEMVVEEMLLSLCTASALTAIMKRCQKGKKSHKQAFSFSSTSYHAPGEAYTIWTPCWIFPRSHVTPKSKTIGWRHSPKDNLLPGSISFSNVQDINILIFNFTWYTFQNLMNSTHNICYSTSKCWTIYHRLAFSFEKLKHFFHYS